MPTVEERLAYLEGRAGDQTTAIADLRTSITELRGEVRDLRGEMSGGFTTLRGEMAGGFTALRDEMNRRFEAVDVKFTWLMGIQVAMLVTVLGAVVGFYFR